MRCLCLLLAGAAFADDWLEKVAPAMLAEERRIYQRLNEEERAGFRRAFWANKSVTEAEYLERLAYVDGRWGGGKTASGANTDQGRMYLGLGAPTAVHRVPSSRIFYECEIWFYDHAPQTGYRARLQFLFYRPRNLGDFKLYSPQLQTIRALLIPQSSTRGMFPINDLITPADVRARLNPTPAEDDIVEAALGVARGITGSGNTEILARAASPAEALRRDLRTQVRSRFQPAAAPEVRTLQFWATPEVAALDVEVRVRASARIGLAIEEKGTRLEQSEIPIEASSARPVRYIQRFFLLPGDYTLEIARDGVVSSVPVRVDLEPHEKLKGEGFAEEPGEVRIANTPDPRSTLPLEAAERQKKLRAR